MDLASILILVNLLLTCTTALTTPLIIAISNFITRIKKSDCCGSHVELSEIQELKKQIKEMNESFLISKK